ncbi:MAG: hypothetical protein AB7R55_06555 [Gemmatimonadales bacterium]
MIRSTRWGLALAAAALAGGLVATPTMAQDGAKKAGSSKLVGSWEGQYTSDGPTGTIALKVSDKPAWGVVLEITGDVPPPADATGVAAEGNVLTWKHLIGDMDVAFKATLSEDGETLAGTIEATQNGQYVGGGSFSLKRKM